MGKYDDRPYPVGKGKPPVASRWKTGQSGNPKGPKRKAHAGDASLNEMLASIMNTPTSVTVTDPRTGEAKMELRPLKEVILKGLVVSAATGKLDQRVRITNLLFKLGAFDLKDEDRQPTPEQQSQALFDLVAALAAEAERERPL